MPPNNEIQNPVQADRVIIKSNKGLIVVLIVIIILLIAASGALGYFWKQEVDDHGLTVKQLTEQTNIVNENSQVIRDAKLEPSFRKVLQDHANNDCSSKSAVVFNTTTSIEKNGDNSTKKYFAVGQFVCNNGGMAIGSPIRFSAAQSQDGITWEFTYGSSSADPTSLPGYIFNTDPALYNRKYNNPKQF